ncbi:tetranectin isoform X2 [Protopterus annectens]|nr:tetranectin isoform X2 [Protopterus annectens]
MINDLKEEIGKVWQELSLLQEKQALQTVCLKGINIYQKCFLAFPELKTYHEASEHCISLGGTLSIPRNIEENDSLYKYVQKSVENVAEVWIGANDLLNEGTWADATGSTVSFKNWESDITGQPDGKTQENCAAFSATANGKWFDANCRVQKPFVCEFNIA